MEIFANLVKIIKDIVMSVIDLCRFIKLKDDDKTEDAILGIIDNAIDGVADAAAG